MADTVETALVYIYSTTPSSQFVGCGVLIDGELIATCRHVWREATSVAAEPLKVEIEYPGARVDGPSFKSLAHLADECDDLEIGEPAPDLVLLEPQRIPDGVLKLQLATQDRFEVGSGYVHARVLRPDPAGNLNWVEAFPKGNIDANQRISDGLRQFTGKDSHGYWFTRGSSGSPLFLDNGMQLAGILSEAELGANEWKSPLHESFVIPATTIRRFVSRREARSAAEYKGVDPAVVRSFLNSLGEAPIAEISARIREFVDANRPLVLLSAGAVAAPRATSGPSLQSRRELKQHIDALVPSQAVALAREMQPALARANAQVRSLVRALDPRNTRFTDPVMAKLVLEAWVLTNDDVTGPQMWVEAIVRVNPK